MGERNRMNKGLDRLLSSCGLLVVTTEEALRKALGGLDQQRCHPDLDPGNNSWPEIDGTGVC